MSFEDAERELQTAMVADGEPTPLEQAPAPTTPEGTTEPAPVQPHHASTQPRDPSTGKFIRPDGSLSDTPEPVQDTFDGGKFNPDTLAPELQPAWKQLQADYTRKMQEIAEQRKQFEGIDPVQAREALDLYQSLQDPNYLVEFHGQLTKALEGQGLTNAQARQEAARITEEAATSPSLNVNDQLAALREDPDLAPVAESFDALQKNYKSLEDRLNAFEQEKALREEQEAIRVQQMAWAGELQRQEMAIKSANPHYTDEAPEGEVSDMDAIYALSAHTDGNLLAAQDLYERIGSMHVQRFIDQKTAVTPGVTTPPGIDGASEVPTPIGSLDEADRAAQEYLRQAGIDTIG